MYGINLQLFNSKLKISIFTICLKIYILRKTCGFAQIAQKNSAKPCKTHCVSCAKVAQKFAKKICAKIVQILRKRFSHFVETLGTQHLFKAEYGGGVAL